VKINCQRFLGPLTRSPSRIHMPSSSSVTQTFLGVWKPQLWPRRFSVGSSARGLGGWPSKIGAPGICIEHFYEYHCVYYEKYMPTYNNNNMICLHSWSLLRWFIRWAQNFPGHFRIGWGACSVRTHCHPWLSRWCQHLGRPVWCSRRWISLKQLWGK